MRVRVAESIDGIDGPLPDGERVLWQGRPEWRVLAATAYHVNKVAAYFAALIALRAAFAMADGLDLGAAVLHALWVLPLAAAGLGLLAGMAWLAARGAVYALTTRRVVMKIGVAVPITINLPLRLIGAAALRRTRGAHGDIPLALDGADRIAYLHLWPHARPWRFRQPEPMLRAVPDAARVAELLGGALAAVHGAGAATAQPAGRTQEAASRSEREAQEPTRRTDRAPQAAGPLPA